jgi:hypothetical protein
MKFTYLTLALASLYSTQEISDKDANAALDAICKGQNTLNGCSLRSMCNSVSSPNATLCSPVSLLATVCTTDAKADTNCNSYNSECNPGAGKTPAKQCTDNKPFPGMLPTKNITDILTVGCIAMAAMKECDNIVPAGQDGLMPLDNLALYSEYCIAMPGMNECKAWKDMCSGSNNFEKICTKPVFSKDNKAVAASSSTSSSKGSDASTVRVGVFSAAAMMVSGAVLLAL